MATTSTLAKAIGSTSLKLVVTGSGRTAGRRAHLIRLRESLLNDLKIHASGQLYLLIEVALQRLIEELKEQKGIAIIQVEDELGVTQKDVEDLEQHEAKMRKKDASEKAAKKPRKVKEATET